ncbi:MAG: hypothetical protein KAJ95_05505 [Gammaproteobacteria bacterium]|nr:hypothetical protein [Gammaproteobacteria bacterium]
MFRRSDDEQSSISVFVEKKTRMLKSKVDYALHGEHTHYFSKKESLDPTSNPKCKVCGLLLSDYKVQKKFEKLNKEVKKKID